MFLCIGIACCFLSSSCYLLLVLHLVPLFVVCPLHIAITIASRISVMAMCCIRCCNTDAMGIECAAVRHLLNLISIWFSKLPSRFMFAIILFSKINLFYSLIAHGKTVLKSICTKHAVTMIFLFHFIVSHLVPIRFIPSQWTANGIILYWIGYCVKSSSLYLVVYTVKWCGHPTDFMLQTWWVSISN